MFFFLRADWVKVHGDKYVKDMMIVCQQFIHPVFLCIHRIFVLPNMDIVFFSKRVQTIGYNKEMHSYEVVILDEFITTFHNNLLDHHPLDLYSIIVEGVQKDFVRMKYDLADAEE